MDSTALVSSDVSLDQTSSADTSTSDTASPKQSWAFTVSTDGQLHVFRFHSDTGELNDVGATSIGGSGGDVFIAMRPGSRQLFAVYNRALSWFEFDPDTGSLAKKGSATTLGSGTYVGVAADERHFYVAHYNENGLSYLTRNDSGFSEPVAFSAGQKVHSAWESAEGGWVLVPCLGSNYVAQYRRTADDLVAAATPTVAVDGGPRHLAFHPQLPVVYSISELTAEVRAFSFSTDTGIGAVFDTETIGIEAQGKFWGSDVKVTGDGKSLFAVERNAKKIYHFAVQPDGSLESSGMNADLGGVVRVFDLAADGGYVVAGNDVGQLLALRFDAGEKTLTPVANSPTGLGIVYTTLLREF